MHKVGTKKVENHTMLIEQFSVRNSILRIYGYWWI